MTLDFFSINVSIPYTSLFINLIILYSWVFILIKYKKNTLYELKKSEHCIFFNMTHSFFFALKYICFVVLLKQYSINDYILTLLCYNYT